MAHTVTKTEFLSRNSIRKYHEWWLDISILVIFDTNWISGQKNYVCPSVWQFPLCFHHYCHSSWLLPSHTEIKWMRVDSVFFLYANRGFHVEICAKTRVSLHSQLHSNYVVFALLLYEKCRTVAEKKNHPTRGNLCNKSCANLFADWTFPRNPMHIHAIGM